jgi:hypothetical protein
MTRSAPAAALLLLAAGCAPAIGSALDSATVNPSARPNFGDVQLSAGFTPDPHHRRITAGGSVETRLGGCRAHVSTAPDLTLRYRAGTLPLIVTASSRTDVVLLIRTPDGRYVCDDDSGEGTDARVTFERPQSGSYAIWVGTFAAQSGGLPPADVYISELRSTVGAQPATGRLNVSGRPTYETLTLRAGFRPDPRSIPLSAGGNDAVPRELGNQCRGYVNGRAPDVNLNYQAGSLPLNLYATSAVDLTLVVNLPDGRWMCSDDARGTHPWVNVRNPSSGTYNIWVGTYRAFSGSLPSAVLHVSELDPRW